MIAVCRFAIDRIFLHRRDLMRIDRSIGKIGNMEYASADYTWKSCYLIRKLG